MADTPKINVVGGRRLGKTYVGAAKFLARVFGRMGKMGADVRAGKRKPWAGIGLKPSMARQLDPDVEAWVVAPRELHLNRCRANILGYFKGQASRLVHPKLKLADSGRQLWLLSSGVSARIRFVVAGSVLSMVSAGIHEAWIEECGLTDGAIIGALGPATWEHGESQIRTGTPALGTEHWYTREVLRGLDPSHPYYVKDVVERDARVTTISGSSMDSPLEQVRKAAEAAKKTNSKAWGALWVDGDWRAQDVYIYSEFDPNLHVIDYDPIRRKLGHVSLRRPDLVLGVKDWAYTETSDGAIVCLHVWHRNPLDEKDQTRPLIVAVDDFCGAMPYTVKGWYGKMSEFRSTYHIRKWIADPSRHELLRSAGKHIRRIGPIYPAPKEDKPGRITLVQSLLHHQEGVAPALYISKRCQALQRQMPNYRRKFTALGGVSDDPYDYDDHVLDCLAFAAGYLMVGGESAAPPGFR